MIFKIKLPILDDLFGLDSDDRRPDDIAKDNVKIKESDGCTCSCWPANDWDFAWHIVLSL